MDNQIITQLDPVTGNLLITVPKSLVLELSWTLDSSIVWIIDEDDKTITGKLVK